MSPKKTRGEGGRRFPHVLSWECRCCTDWKEMDGWKYYCYKLHSDALRYLNVSKMGRGWGGVGVGASHMSPLMGSPHILNRDWSLMDGSWKYYWRWITLSHVGLTVVEVLLLYPPSDEKLNVMCGINSGSHRTPLLSKKTPDFDQMAHC